MRLTISRLVRGCGPKGTAADTDNPASVARTCAAPSGELSIRSPAPRHKQPPASDSDLRRSLPPFHVKRKVPTPPSRC